VEVVFYSRRYLTHVLVINAGSSSIKYALFDGEHRDQLLLKGSIERVTDHRIAMDLLFEEIDHKGSFEIKGVGHRVVHGGEDLRAPTLITPEIIEQIKHVGRFVPLHCGPNLIGIEVAQKKLPSVPQVAIFDTAPYTTLDPKAYLYGIPLEFYEKYRIRKYGFHGINHSYVAHQVTSLLGRETLKVITCHLGNGCSVTAFENGKSVDTSMGLTPLEGLMMGSRCGDIDPSAVLYLMDVLGLQTEEMVSLLNKKCGLLGFCGSNDMRDIHRMAKEGSQEAKWAIEIFVYRVQKYIGAYIAALKGVDVIAFTGGIGEHDAQIREKIVSCLSYIGAFVDPQANQQQETLFSSKDSKVVLMTIPANEELVIAQQTSLLIQPSP
jgi:acetate kinase